MWRKNGSGNPQSVRLCARRFAPFPCGIRIRPNPWARFACRPEMKQEAQTARIHGRNRGGRPPGLLPAYP